MFLLRTQHTHLTPLSDNQSKDHSQFYSNLCSNTPEEISIYPCCYQLQTKLSHSQNIKSHSKHQCFPGDDSTSSLQPFSFILNTSTSSPSKNANKLKLENPQISCSLCEKPFHSASNLAFYNCLHCKKQFCSKCSSQIHSKAKFLSHQILQIQEKSNPLTQSNFYNCLTHTKPRKYLLKNKLVCDLCFKEETGKIPHETQVIQPSFVEENIKFSLQYFNEIYHNQANNMAELKQNLNKFYKDSIQRLQAKFKSSLSQIQKIEASIKTNFTQTISELSKMVSEVQTISTCSQTFSQFLSKQVLNTRITVIQQKMFDIQYQCEDFIHEILYDYKIGDKEKNQQLLEQFLKTLNLIKTKRQEEESTETNRSTLRHNMKTSRTTSRLSSQKLTASKDNRCQSSFNKQDNMSSSKLNSSVKDKERNSLAKGGYQNQDSNRKNVEMNKNSMPQNLNRNSMGKSMSKNSSQQPSAVSSRNNSALFNEKQRQIDVKELQKAEYQDLNLNLKKIMGTKKMIESQQPTLQNQNSPKQPSSSTSLQKNNKENNDPRSIKLIRENEKSTVNSGSFLKIFDQKNRSGGRKNYLVSAEELPEPDGSSKVVQFESKSKASPSNQVQKKKIKDQIYGSNRESSTNKLIEGYPFERYKARSPSVVNSIQSKKDPNSKNSQKSGENNRQTTLDNRSSIVDNLLAMSDERRDSKIISDFNFKSGQDRVINDMTKSLVSEFSCIINGESSQSHVFQSIKDVQITESLKFQDEPRKANKSPVKTSKSIAKPEISKSVFKDSTNTMKASQKVIQEKGTVNQINEKMKKKPDFMDMREKMRKPNYLSTKLNNNLNGPIEKKMEQGKK